MKLNQLEYVVTRTLRARTVLHRIQRIKARPRSVRIGHLHVPPRCLLLGRFDFAGDEVAYLAESSQTSLYECIARREAKWVTMADLRLRELVQLSATRALQVLDLTPHGNTWPVLQSMRLHATQELSDDIFGQGYDGIIYRSAQQPDAECYALFRSRLVRAFRLESKWPLIDTVTGNLHWALADALRGAQLPLVP
jgi:hypothetical protein